MTNAFRGRMGIQVKAGRARSAAATGVFALRGRDRPSLVAALERIAAIAPGMSERELRNLTRQLCRETAAAGLARSDTPVTRAGDRSRGLAGDREIRVTMTAWNPDQLAERARRAARLAGAVHGGPMISEAGVRVSCGAGGRVVLVFPGGVVTDGAGEGGAAWLAAEAASLARSLDALRWLEGLGASATAAMGHGHGEIAGLVWAGSLSVPEAARLAAQHGEVRRGPRATRTAMVRVIADEATASGLSASCGLALAADEGPRSHVLAGPVAGVRDLTRQAAALGVTASVLNAAHALHTPAMLPYAAPLRSVLAQVRFGPPRRRLVSTVTARELARELRPQDDIAAMLCAQLTSPVRFREALQTASDGADLIFCAGADEALVAAAAAACGVPAAGFPAVREAGGGRLDGDRLAAGFPADEGTAACAAALFTAGVLPDAAALAPAPIGPDRPVDIAPDRPADIGADRPVSLSPAPLSLVTPPPRLPEGGDQALMAVEEPAGQVLVVGRPGPDHLVLGELAGRGRILFDDVPGGPAVHLAHVPDQVAHPPAGAGRDGGVRPGAPGRPGQQGALVPQRGDVLR